jgi:hypothetical protein
MYGRASRLIIRAQGYLCNASSTSLTESVCTAFTENLACAAKMYLFDPLHRKITETLLVIGQAVEKLFRIQFFRLLPLLALPLLPGIFSR